MDTDVHGLETNLTEAVIGSALHSSLFLPEAEPALRTGITATAAAVLELMGK